MNEIKKTVKTYILEEFLPGEDPAGLADETPLVSGGILDSMATLKMAAFLESKYGIQIEAHEMNTKNFNTIDSLASLVESKLGSK
ncbi:acyl carrier protein [candidate division KSB1 bacterium]|nr:acyl carrier protein [candidate division KSB1 bacterium]